MVAISEMPATLYVAYLKILLMLHLISEQNLSFLKQVLPGGGVLSMKVYPGTYRWNGSQNQPITMTPYLVQKLE